MGKVSQSAVRGVIFMAVAITYFKNGELIVPEDSCGFRSNVPRLAFGPIGPRVYGCGPSLQDRRFVIYMESLKQVAEGTPGVFVDVGGLTEARLTRGLIRGGALEIRRKQRPEEVFTFSPQEYALIRQYF